MPRLTLLLVLCLSVVAGAALAQPSVTAVRVGEHPDKTRFVLEMSEAPSYRVFTLPDPARVVIDLPELDWRLDGDALPSQRGGIQALRYGLFAPGTSRVVLDMAGPTGIKSVLVLPPSGGAAHRLVIDLEPIGEAAFLSPESRRPALSKVPLPKPQAAALPTVPPAAESDERPTIIIDAGHGGVDPGAIGVSGTFEKDVVLAYARQLRDQLKATGRYHVVLTRDEDIFLRLRDRFRLAQQAAGDLFLSLHVNTVKEPYVGGASVYTLSEQASDKEAAALAQKENLSDIIAGVTFTDQPEDVNKILIDLAQRETMNLSKNFANMLVKDLGSTVQLLRNTHRYAGFAVLKSPTVPSVLVEFGYISNPEEERRLLTPAYRAKVSKAMIQAIDRYFQWQDSLNRS